MCLPNVPQPPEPIFRGHDGDTAHLQLEADPVPHERHGHPPLPRRVPPQLQRHSSAHQLHICDMPYLCISSFILYEDGGYK